MNRGTGAGRGAVLLDLDDTLYAYGPCHEAGLAAAQRHLGAEVDGAHDPDAFRALHDAVRAELASVYMGDAALSLAEIAFLLGYSDQSAFSRAYRRWTGRAPTAARG